ncbi:hypothetical protein [Labilibaculum sp.]|uniref:hypothetical protein n=1 Tax=Labilibaculum sp. TaxID=2060723 RepID=UPI003561F577
MQYVKLVILSFFILSIVSSNAQVGQNEVLSQGKNINSPGKVNIIQDVRIKELLETDKMINTSNAGFSGYRIQIFSGGSTDREKAFQIKGEFNELFPEERAYVVYKAPDFRVYVGNFRSKIESIELDKACLQFFPNSYPVKTYILFSELEPIEREFENVVLEEDDN